MGTIKTQYYKVSWGYDYSQGGLSKNEAISMMRDLLNAWDFVSISKQ